MTTVMINLVLLKRGRVGLALSPSAPSLLSVAYFNLLCAKSRVITVTFLATTVPLACIIKGVTCQPFFYRSRYSQGLLIWDVQKQLNQLVLPPLRWHFRIVNQIPNNVLLKKRPWYRRGSCSPSSWKPEAKAIHHVPENQVVFSFKTLNHCGKSSR